MLKETIRLIVITGILVLSACDQNEEKVEKQDAQPENTVTVVNNHDEPHPYGGWYCPDNFGGFPPVDIQDLKSIPVITDRLPTQEETGKGWSLIFVDTTKYPDAKPLKMDLPRLARTFTQHNGMNELIIVIQAVIIGSDTIVGYRFPNGGNGSARIGEVTFLSEYETQQLGSKPIVYDHLEINASTTEIWKAITSTRYAKDLGVKFDQQDFFESEWTDNSRANLEYFSENERAVGVVMTLFGSLYLHIDYDFEGRHYTEKLLILEDSETKTSELHIVSGPIPENFELKKDEWLNWLTKVKTTSET